MCVESLWTLGAGHSVLKVCELLALDTVCWQPTSFKPLLCPCNIPEEVFYKKNLICHKDILGYPAEILTVDTFSEEASVCFGLAWPVGKVLLGRNCVRSTWEKQETELKSLDKFMGEKLQKKRGLGEANYMTFLLLGTAGVLAAFVLILTSFTEKIFMGRFAPPPLYWLLCSVQVYWDDER